MAALQYIIVIYRRVHSLLGIVQLLENSSFFRKITFQLFLRCIGVSDCHVCAILKRNFQFYFSDLIDLYFSHKLLRTSVWYFLKASQPFVKPISENFTLLHPSKQGVLNLSNDWFSGIRGSLWYLFVLHHCLALQQVWKLRNKIEENKSLIFNKCLS